MFGYPTETAEQVGYRKELHATNRAMREVHRGIVVLPRHDYGFAWTPHGTCARDLAHFVERFGFPPHEATIAATYGSAKMFIRSHEMDQIKESNDADCVVVDGKPLENIAVLQEHKKLNISSSRLLPLCRVSNGYPQPGFHGPKLSLIRS